VIFPTLIELQKLTLDRIRFQLTKFANSRVHLPDESVLHARKLGRWKRLHGGWARSVDGDRGCFQLVGAQTRNVADLS